MSRIVHRRLEKSQIHRWGEERWRHCRICGSLTKIYSRGACLPCYAKEQKVLKTQKGVCDLTAKQDRRTRRDPESLTSTFMRELIMIDCEEEEK